MKDFNIYIERDPDEPGNTFSILKSPDNGISWFEVDNNLMLTDNNSLNVSPNPFKKKVKITFSILESGIVNITIYNLHGEIIRTLVNENKTKGEYEIIWDGRDNNEEDITNGIYFYSIKINGQTTDSKKMIVM